VRSRHYVRALCAVTAALCLTAPQASATGQPPPSPKPVESLVDKPVPGSVALQRFAGRMGDLARRNGMSESLLTSVLRTDRTSWIDQDARLFYVDDAVPGAMRGADSPAKIQPAQLAADVFALHSHPGADRVIYLDFDGYLLTGTAWNVSKNLDPVDITPWDTDGDPSTFSAAERAVVQEVWQRVAEDYAPFDVDVTTEDPGAAAINRSGVADNVYGTRIVVDPTDWYQAGCACGGVAYVGSFDDTDNGSHQPGFAFTLGLGNGAKSIAEAASHEAGHTLGLTHDGTADVKYYGGQGSWAPIMGVGYNKAITQWSKGEYAGANNAQDDFAVMTQSGVTYRPDDHGNSTATATAVTAGTTADGVIAAGGDADYFVVALPAGSHTITAAPAAVGADLDIKMTLLNGAGAVLGTYDPASGQSSASTATGLGAATTWNLAGGTYYVRIEGTGYADPLTTGYSAYGSRGAFTLRAS